MYFKSLFFIEIQIPLSKYLKQQKNRAFEIGGCNYTTCSISVAEIARRMINLFMSYLNIHLEFRLKLIIFSLCFHLISMTSWVDFCFLIRFI